MQNIIFNTFDALERIEKEHGMLGTIFGLLLIGVTLMASLFILYVVVRFNIDVINFVVENLWFK